MPERLTDDEFRLILVRAIQDAEENLRRYDASLVPGAHAPDCDCARGDCTMRRIEKVREEAIKAGTWPTDEEWDRLSETIEEAHDARTEAD